MRNFNHIILDLELKKNNLTSSNWLQKLNENKNNSNFLINVNLYGKLSANNYKTSSNFEDSNTVSLKQHLGINSKTVSAVTALKHYNFPINDIVNINFLRKERLYTKLKYSRSPAYDIVSGGAAALLAGFIGFLISEKFGFELVDSGDFYYLFIYIVFASFSIRPLLTTLNYQNNASQVFSIKEVIKFFTTVILLFFKKFKF